MEHVSADFDHHLYNRQKKGKLLEAAGEGTILAAHVSPTFRPAFPSSAIISERSSPSRVRCAAHNNGAPLTAPGRSEQPFLDKRERLTPNGPLVGHHFAAKMVPFFAATDTAPSHARRRCESAVPSTSISSLNLFTLRSVSVQGHLRYPDSSPKRAFAQSVSAKRHAEPGVAGSYSTRT